jgi:hypothetical protein
VLQTPSWWPVRCTPWPPRSASCALQPERRFGVQAPETFLPNCPIAKRQHSLPPGCGCPPGSPFSTSAFLIRKSVNGVSRACVKGCEVPARFAERRPGRVVGSAKLEKQRKVVYLPKVEFAREYVVTTKGKRQTTNLSFARIVR